MAAANENEDENENEAVSSQTRSKPNPANKSAWQNNLPGRYRFTILGIILSVALVILICESMSLIGTMTTNAVLSGWKTTPGKILKIVNWQDKTNQKQSRVIYEYEVAGKKYFGSGLKPLPNNSVRGIIGRLGGGSVIISGRLPYDYVQKHYQIDKPIVVHYQPSDPGNACLEP